MIKSKLTAKAQTTIPQPVREALRLRVGDEIIYQIEGDRVILMKSPGASSDDPFATRAGCRDHRLSLLISTSSRTRG